MRWSEVSFRGESVEARKVASILNRRGSEGGFRGVEIHIFKLDFLQELEQTQDRQKATESTEATE